MAWIGALIVLTVTTWTGFDAASRFQKRPGHIRQWKNALQMIEAEMVYGQSSLWEVCHSLGKLLPRPINEFYQTLIQHEGSCQDFAELWTSQLKKHWYSNALSKSEYEILTQFGRTLGQHDITQQQKHIQLTLHHLDRELHEALEEGEKYQRMARGLGVLSGLLVIILLL